MDRLAFDRSPRLARLRPSLSLAAAAIGVAAILIGVLRLSAEATATAADALRMAALFGWVTFAAASAIDGSTPFAPAGYRASVLIGWTGAAAVFLFLLRLPPGLAAFGLAVSAVAVFAAGLTATGAAYGWWEDNAPPSPEVIEGVLEAHRGLPGRGRRAPAGKRALDILGAASGLLLAAVPGSAILVALWLEDPGPLLFAKNAVGRGGANFRQWKIRTMRRGAEDESGPVWSERDDRRVLRLGRLLRRTALDETPQLINILFGQMSLVGPRPQRTVLVAGYLRELPEYAERHRIAPGLAGLAQVAGHYYLTARQKLRFDRLYLEHAGLGFDVRLILIAFAVVFWLRWRPGWNGRIPRRWLHRR